MGQRRVKLLSAQRQRPRLQGYHQFAYQLESRFVRKLALCVKTIRRVAYHDLRPVEKFQIEIYPHLAQMILRPCRAKGAAARPHDRGGFPGKGLIGHTRNPIYRVFQHTGNRIIVLGRGKQKRVSVANLLAQTLYRQGIALTP